MTDLTHVKAQARRERWGCPAWCVEDHQSGAESDANSDHYGKIHVVESSDLATREATDDNRVGVLSCQLKPGENADGLMTEPRILLDIAARRDELPLSTAEARELAFLLNCEADMLDADADRLCDREWCDLFRKPIGEEPMLGKAKPDGRHQEHRRVLGVVHLPTGALDKEPVTLTVRVQAWVDDVARVEIRHDEDGKALYNNSSMFLALDETGPLVALLEQARACGVTGERQGGRRRASSGPAPSPRATCPAWCTTDHVKYIAEGGDPFLHKGLSFDEYLSTIRNEIDGCVERDGGASYAVTVSQESSEAGGFAGPSVVEMIVWDVDQQRTIMSMTSGETRVLARRLDVLADEIDIRLR